MKVIKRLLSGALLSVMMSLSSASALTVYSAGPGSLIKKLADGYTKATGEPVEVYQATTGKVLARLEAEAANPQADVVISASWDSALDLEQRGWLLPFTSQNAAAVPVAYKGPSYVAQGLSALALVWNTQSGTPRPADWSDLARSEFKDKVNLPDPAQSGTALELLVGLHNAMGEGSWTLLSSLQKNGATVAGANAQALNPVLQGAKAAVFGAVDYVAYGSQARGESIDVIFPTSGTVVAPRPMMILKSSKRPQEAKAFIDYVLSEEGQALVAETYLIPARSDVAARRPGVSELLLLPGANEAEVDVAAVLGRFSTLFERK